jgi:hypothetical protein
VSRESLVSTLVDRTGTWGPLWASIVDVNSTITKRHSDKKREAKMRAKDALIVYRDTGGNGEWPRPILTVSERTACSVEPINTEPK